MSIEAERQIIKYKCLKSLSFFTRYFFKQRNSKKFIINNHHQLIIDTLEKVAKGELKRVIFNLPPRYGKTELIVKNFIAWSLSLNPSAKFIHLSYSDSLALDNSEEIKDLISDDKYRSIFSELEIKKDSRAKNKWYTSEKGGVLARSSSGQVTGFGAGRVDDESEEIDILNELELKQIFGGAIIIDDPIKPDEAFSEQIRSKVNLKFETTIRSRTNSRNTPIIIVMQRLHEEDLCGYLLDLEPEEWTVISMPAINNDGTPLWESKHNLSDLQKIKDASPYVFETQYMQRPTPFEQGLIYPNWIEGEFNNNLVSIYGLDFGFDDPDALVKVAVDTKQKKIYVQEMLYQNGLGTEQLAERLIFICGKNNLIIADNADNRLINDLYYKGVNIKGCRKGAGSVLNRIKVIQSYQIVVEPNSHNIKKSLRNHVWLDNRAGIPERKYKHLPDAFGYATMELIGF